MTDFRYYTPKVRGRQVIMDWMKRKSSKENLREVDAPPILVAEQIKSLRLKQGWSQLEVARQVGVERTLIGNYEQGLNYPPLPTLQKLARVFGVTIDYLVNGESKPIEGFQDRELLDFCLKADRLGYEARGALKRVIEGLLATEKQESTPRQRVPV